MTIETRYLIELADVLGVEFQCHNCGAKTLLDKAKVLLECPLCKSDWLLPGTDEEKILRTFLNVIQSAKAKMDGRPFSLRLQIAAPPDQEAKE